MAAQHSARPQLFAVATAMLKELWTRKQANAAGERKALKANMAKIDAQIDQAVERIIETSVLAVSRVWGGETFRTARG